MCGLSHIQYYSLIQVVRLLSLCDLHDWPTNNAYDRNLGEVPG